MRLPTPDPPDEIAVRDGLAHALFLPAGEPEGAVVVLHGAGSCKESHSDFARAARARGLAAIAFDQRGHGASAGPCDDRLVEDVAAIAARLPPAADGGRLPLALRGSSMGGYVALLAAARVGADAVVAICPAGSEHLLRGLRSGDLDFDADAPGLERFLAGHELEPAVAALRAPLLLLHAEGDERIPVSHSRELHRIAGSPVKQLIAMPGGHHRSLQHDPELQGESLRFVARAFAARGARAAG